MATNHRTIKNFWDYIRNSWRVFKIVFKFMPVYTVVIIFLTILIGVIPVFAFKAMGSLIDSIISGISTGVTSAIWISLLVYAILNVLPGVATVFRRYTYRIFYLRVQDHIDLMILKKRSEFDIAQYEDTKFLDFMQRAFISGPGPIVNLIDRSMDVSQNMAAVISSSIAALILDWKVFVLVVITSIPSFIVEIKYGGRLWNINRQNSFEQRRQSDLRRFFSVGNRFAVIDGKLFQVGTYFLSQIKSILSDFTTKQLDNERGRTVSSLTAVIFSFAGLFIATGMVIQGAIAGALAVGTIVYAFQTLARISGQATSLLSNLAMMLERNLYVTDIFQVLDTKPTLKRAGDPKILGLKSGGAPVIKFEDVSFKYGPESDWALHDISFELSPGEKLGLVGNNGSGKSTLVRLLLRIHDPTKGRILVNGTDLRQIDLDEWWNNIGVLLQDYTTYHFPVKQAIAIGRLDEPIQEDVVKKSAAQSTAESFILGLEKTYDHMIGVEFGGIEPSKGQRQKLAIARALYRQPKLLILDEPTASIDSESSAVIFKEIEELPNTVSAILISHNFATIKRASKIIVLDRGRMVEQGTHDSLIKDSGQYARAYLEQKKEYE